VPPAAVSGGSSAVVAACFRLPSSFAGASQFAGLSSKLIADPALPGKWQPGEEVIYLLVFEGELPDGSSLETKARRFLTSRLSETLSIPILDDWHESIWEAGQMENLIIGLETGGDCQKGYIIQLGEIEWKEVVIKLLKGQRIQIPKY
jgi:hypothetical protein